MSTSYDIPELEIELEEANTTIIELRALLDTIISVVHDTSSDVRQLLREAGEL